MVKYGEIWWNMVKHGEIWWNMVKYDVYPILIPHSNLIIYSVSKKKNTNTYQLVQDFVHLQ